MGKVNYAAIDIGSNAVRLLIKSIDREAVQEKKIKKVMMLRVPLRLGFDVFSIGELSEKKAESSFVITLSLRSCARLLY